MNAKDLDTQRYWTNRLRRGDITAVGRLGASDRLNKMLYDLARRNVSRLCMAHEVLPVNRVLDVGTGWGYWVDFWHAVGVDQVDAIDFAQQSVDEVRARWPTGGQYHVADVADRVSLANLEPYPLISCMNVLLHILDDGAFQDALANLAQLVSPGGHLLLAEPVTVGATRQETGRTGTSRSRQLAAYAPPGLDLIAVQPAAAIAGDPIDAPNRLALFAVRTWWLSVLAGDRFLPPLRPLVASVTKGTDESARRRGWATTGKLLLFRRPG